MAAVAGVVCIIVVGVSGRAFSIVVAINTEVLVVLEGCLQPCLRCTALRAVALYLEMQGIARTAVTAVALLPQIGLNQLVRGLANRAEGLSASVVAVSGDTILLDQLLMKGDVLLLPGDGQPFGCFEAYLLDLVRRGVAI